MTLQIELKNCQLLKDIKFFSLSTRCSPKPNLALESSSLWKCALDVNIFERCQYFAITSCSRVPCTWTNKTFFWSWDVQASGVPQSTRLKYCYCNILTLGLMSWYSSIFCQISKTPFSSGVIVKAARSTYNSMSCMWGIHCNFGCNFLKHLCIRMIFWFNWLVLIPFSSYIRHPTLIIVLPGYISKYF